jgi:hypothetical protein
VSSKCVFGISVSDLGDKVVIMEIIYYLLHVVIIGRGVDDEVREVRLTLWDDAELRRQ